MKEVGQVLKILKESNNAIESENFKELKFLSEDAIRISTINQDPDNIIVAVLIYSLGKVYERKHYHTMDGWSEFQLGVKKNLKFAIKHLEKREVEKSRIHLGKIRNSINKISGSLGGYIRDVFKKTEINKAFKLYEHGLSSEQTAKLLGITLWDLASYIGHSSIGNANISISVPVSKRVKLAEDIFR